MNESQIFEQVSYEIDNWQNKMAQRKVYTKISPKAKKFIVELIENIQEDPSEYWKLKTPSESLQILAIGRIPEALDIIVRHRRLLFHHEIHISSWELWNSLSRILIRFCFIPEKDM